MTPSSHALDLELLACPVHRQPMTDDGPILTCRRGCRYPLVRGIPVLLRSDVPETLWVHRRSLARAWEHVEGRVSDELFLDTLGIGEELRSQLPEALKDSGSAVDPVVSHLLAATGGRLYRPLLGRIDKYPIPSLPMRTGNGRLLDLGCGWGRWSLAAANAGCDVVGIDPSLGATLTAKRVADKLGVRATFVVGDARHLPFADARFQTVFSYSVLQHFSTGDVDQALSEVRRVLDTGGSSCIQMANAFGLWSLFVQAARGFRETTGFEVRYRSPRALLRSFVARIGPTTVFPDGFFGLGVRPSDRSLLVAHYRAIVDASGLLCGVAKRFPTVALAADSLFLCSQKMAGA